MKISVVVCTHNRADSLLRTLESLLPQSVQSDSYEIIIVDSASTDSTAEQLHPFIEQKLITYIYVPAPGLSQARNCGWQNATGDIIAYIDDDATVSSTYIQNIESVFSKLSNNDVCLGGKVSLALAKRRPVWLANRFLFCLGALDCGEKQSILNETPFYLHGCNMIFWYSTIEKFGGFNEGLGRNKSALISGEDVELQMRIAKTGGVLLYNPYITVTHHVDSSRLRISWFIKRMFWEGVSVTRIKLEREAVQNTKMKTVLNEIVVLLRELRAIEIQNHPLSAFFFTVVCLSAHFAGRVFETLRH